MVRSICILYLKAEWLYYKWLSFDCPCWSVKSCESMSLLSLSPAFSNSSARNRSSPPKLTQRLVPSPDSWSFPKFSPGLGVLAQLLAPTMTISRKILFAINSKPFKSTNHVINYKVNPIFTRLTSLWLGCHNNQLCCWMHHFQLLGGMKH